MTKLQMSQRWLDEYTLSERIEIHTVCWPKVERKEQSDADKDKEDDARRRTRT
jgi:hypothetical protein